MVEVFQWAGRMKQVQKGEKWRMESGHMKEKWKVKVLGAQSCPTLRDPMGCSQPGSSVHGLPRQEYWSRLPFPSPGNLPYPRIELGSLALQVDSLPSEPPSRFDPWVGKIPWRKAWQPAPIFLPEESHGQRSLADSSPWGRKELDTTEAT